MCLYKGLKLIREYPAYCLDSKEEFELQNFDFSGRYFDLSLVRGLKHGLMAFHIIVQSSIWIILALIQAIPIC